MQPDKKTPLTTSDKVLKLWYILVFGFFIPLAPFGILYTSIVTGNRTWMSLFVVTFVADLAAFFMILSGIKFIAPLGAIIMLLVWLLVTIFLFSTAKKFLYLSSLPPELKVPADSIRPHKKDNEVTVMGKKLIITLNKWKKEIESVQIQNDIDELIKLCNIVMQRNDEESKKFFSRYSETLDTMLSKYDEIENTRINSPEMVKTMELIEKSITDIVVVFRNEINKMYKSDLRNVSAETKAFMQELRNKGLIE